MTNHNPDQQQNGWCHWCDQVTQDPLMGYLSLVKLLQLPLGTIALVCKYVHITYIDRHVRFERREIWSRLLKITYHTLHFKLMVSKNKIPILAKIVYLGSYLKVFTGIKKKIEKKIFFLLVENLSLGILEFSKIDFTR